MPLKFKQIDFHVKAGKSMNNRTEPVLVRHLRFKVGSSHACVFFVSSHLEIMVPYLLLMSFVISYFEEESHCVTPGT